MVLHFLMWKAIPNHQHQQVFENIHQQITGRFSRIDFPKPSHTFRTSQSFSNASKNHSYSFFKHSGLLDIFNTFTANLKKIKLIKTRQLKSVQPIQTLNYRKSERFQPNQARTDTEGQGTAKTFYWCNRWAKQRQSDAKSPHPAQTIPSIQQSPLYCVHRILPLWHFGLPRQQP